jgi:hypothetical protein
VNAGIPKERRGAGNGKDGRRYVNALTFHSLRHSLTPAEQCRCIRYRRGKVSEIQRLETTTPTG